MLPYDEIRRMALATSILLTALTLTVGCASAGRGWSSVRQSRPRVNRTEVVPGNWERVEALRVG
jgi:hypothetical protein